MEFEAEDRQESEKESVSVAEVQRRIHSLVEYLNFRVIQGTPFCKMWIHKHSASCMGCSGYDGCYIINRVSHALTKSCLEVKVRAEQEMAKYGEDPVDTSGLF